MTQSHGDAENIISEVNLGVKVGGLRLLKESERKLCQGISRASAWMIELSLVIVPAQLESPEQSV